MPIHIHEPNASNFNCYVNVCLKAAKICNNMLLAISMIGTAEAMNLGQRLAIILIIFGTRLLISLVKIYFFNY